MPQTLEPLLRGHKFFAGLDSEYLTLLTGCASNAVFAADSFLFTEGEPAETFYLIRDGKVALEIATPERGALVVQTLGPGDVAGSPGCSTRIAGSSTGEPSSGCSLSGWTGRACAASVMPIRVSAMSSCNGSPA